MWAIGPPTWKQAARCAMASSWWDAIYYAEVPTEEQQAFTTDRDV